MSLFTGKKGLKHQYIECQFDDTEYASATSASNAKELFVMENGPKYKLFIDNQMDTEVVIFVEHPEAVKEDDYATDPSLYRLLFTKVAGNQTVNYSTGESPQIQFDPGTKIWICQGDDAPTSGKIKFSAW